GELFDSAEDLNMLWDLECAARIAAIRTAESILPEDALLFLNCTPEVFIDERFPRRLASDLKNAPGIDPDRVVVEITERSSEQISSELFAACEHVRSLGFQTAIDDVGAGSSGLNRLTGLTPNWLKLDRELIDGIDHDPVRLNLVRFMLNFARVSGASLIAEGIERPEELETLTRLGVPYAQGFLLARPERHETTPSIELPEAVVAIMQHAGRHRFVDPRAQSIVQASQTPLEVDASMLVADAAAELAQKPHCPGVLLRVGTRITGWSDRRSVEVLSERGDAQARLFDTEHDIPSLIDSSTTVIEALEVAGARPDARAGSPLVLMDGAACCGVITARDLFNLAARSFDPSQTRNATLTGLPGRVVTEQRIAAEIDRVGMTGTPRMDAALIDIRRFGWFNGRYGFELGDTVIRTLAGVILGVLESRVDGEPFLGHIGDDRFVVIAPAGRLSGAANDIAAQFAAELQAWGIGKRRRGVGPSRKQATTTDGGIRSGAEPASANQLGTRIIIVNDAFSGISIPSEFFTAATDLRARSTTPRDARDEIICDGPGPLSLDERRPAA
ncbi:MAG: EAL domain-containing protein, partial [Planctomycetota bacterium]